MRVTLILSKGCKDWKRKRVGSAEFKRVLSMGMIHSNGRRGFGHLVSALNLPSLGAIATWRWCLHFLFVLVATFVHC